MQARIQQQITGLTDTMPATIQKLKDQINQSQIGHKLLQQVNSSDDSKKTLEIVRSFFSSSFGIISDLYIITLLALFFTASPSLYKNGMIKLLPTKAKEKGADIIGKIESVLKKWIKGQIFGIFFIAILTVIKKK